MPFDVYSFIAKILVKKLTFAFLLYENSVLTLQRRQPIRIQFFPHQYLIITASINHPTRFSITVYIHYEVRERRNFLGIGIFPGTNGRFSSPRGPLSANEDQISHKESNQNE